MKNYYNNIGAKDTNVVFADTVSLQTRMNLGEILDREGIDMHMDMVSSDKTAFYVSQKMPVWMREKIVKWVGFTKLDAWLVVEQDNGESYLRRI